jgi:caffeoyl-CoA O-methyltransferase
MHIVHPEIEKYLAGLLPGRPAIFYELEEMAKKEDFPAVGPEVGTLLEILAGSIKAKRILELGSGFGYSGLWFARALPPDGKIILTDFEESNYSLARENFKKAGYAHLMEFKVGDALRLLNELAGPFDIIFNDVDKELYSRVIDPAHALLREGGLFITDNTLWHGKVVAAEADETTRAILDFNLKLKNHRGFRTMQLPLRDGLSISIKKILKTQISMDRETK